MAQKQLTDKQIKWLTIHFKHTKNDVIMEKLNIKHSMLHRIARELGLKKSKQFMKQCQAATTEAARLANKRNNWPPKGYAIPNKEKACFKPGETNLQRLGAKKERERIEKAAEARRNTVKAEKRRVLFGLPQKTKLKVIPAPRVKTSYRHLMRKRGYVVDRGSSDVYYTDKTNRSETTELRAFEKCRIGVKPFTETTN